MKRSLELARLLGRDSLSDLLELRFTIEPRAAALAALRNEPPDLEAIDKALIRMREASTLSDEDTQVDMWVESDIEFHDSLVRATHNVYFEMVMGALSESLLDERTRGVKARIAQGRAKDRTLREHSEIAKAIQARDPEAAHRRMLKHLEQSLTYFWAMPQSTVFSLRPADALTISADHEAQKPSE